MASQPIVGVHVAMFTAAEVLSSAAFIEFRRQVDALLARGDRAGALRLWSSVVLFEHMPPSSRAGDGPVGFPPMRISVCPKSACPRCDQGRGGYVFPWVGIWNRRGTIVPPGFTPQQAWDRHARLDAAMDLLLLQPYRTPCSAEIFVPICGSSSRRFPGILTSCPCKPFNLKFSTTCGAGSWDHHTGLWSNPFRAPLPDIEHLPRHLDALHPKIRAHRALRGWLGSSINGESEFPPACCGCGDPTYRQCLGCIKGVCSACFPVLQICPVCRELSSSDDDSGSFSGCASHGVPCASRWSCGRSAG